MAALRPALVVGADGGGGRSSVKERPRPAAQEAASQGVAGTGGLASAWKSQASVSSI